MNNPKQKCIFCKQILYEINQGVDNVKVESISERLMISLI